ncbi:MAG TPA: DUF1080 domain-containing protein [Sedimentisphaerales bacterium]|nr:DUF1080 domain-containing protein [Phycisphaerae bacterium]HON92271.1 DUF1080 domain-containing protein [Sedimentisphaerales bacterium]HQI29218.1 DUF1080 domain-containing protein [Sedimentisphaerales bacterium]
MNLARIGVAGLLFATVLLSAPVGAGETVEAVVPKEKISLWNGVDFAGWKRFLPDASRDVDDTWSIADGVLRCTGRPAGYMRTETAYADYHLHVEWRWPAQPGNNGVLVHMSGPDVVWPRSLECQLASGNAGDFWVIGGLEFAEHAKGGRRVNGRRTLKLRESSEKPAGEWNQYDIVCKDDWVVVLVNGVLQNVATRCSERSGRICLQSEGAPIEYRNLWLEPLE